MYINSDSETSSVQALIMAATAMKQPEIIKILLENGANIESKDIYGWTAFTAGAYHSNLSMIKFLLQNGDNINAKDENEKTA